MLDSLAIALRGVGYDSRVMALLGFYPVDVPVTAGGVSGPGAFVWLGPLPGKPALWPKANKKHGKKPGALIELLPEQPAVIDPEFERPDWLVRAMREDEEEFF